MDGLDELFRRVNGARLEADLPPGSPGREGRIEFSLTRLTEGRKAAAYLAGRYPEVVRPGARVLDVGCGNGGMLFPFVERGCRGWGLDLGLHPEVVEVAAAAGLLVLHLQGRGEALPFPDAACDLVVLAETLEHVPRPRALGREVARVLRPGGLVYLTTPPRLRFLFGPDPHYGVRGLLLLPDPLQRFVFERLVAGGGVGGRRRERYDVAHIFWTSAGILRSLPGLELAEITSKNWSGPLRRLDWDWIVARKPGA